MSGPYAQGWEQLIATRDKILAGIPSAPVLGKTSTAVLDAITEAADAGELCPSMEELAVLAEVPTKAAVHSAMQRLRKAGLLHFHRVPVGKVITVCATGKTTLMVDADREDRKEPAVSYEPLPLPEPVRTARWTCQNCGTRSDAALDFGCAACLPMRSAAA